MFMLRSLAVVSMSVMIVGCEEKPAQPVKAEAPVAATSSSSAPKATAAPTAPAPAVVAAKPESKVRSGKWEANAPGRGVAYTVASDASVVTLDMGGTKFEGTAHEGGRRYKTQTNEYLIVPTADGFDLQTKDKPTWHVTFSGDNTVIAAEDKKFSLDKVADAFEVKQGGEVIGKVVTEGAKVKVTDASGAAKWDGTDGLVSAWGVLLMKDIGQPMQRVLFTELLARGR